MFTKNQIDSLKPTEKLQKKFDSDMLYLSPQLAERYGKCFIPLIEKKAQSQLDDILR